MSRIRVRAVIEGASGGSDEHSCPPLVKLVVCDDPQHTVELQKPVSGFVIYFAVHGKSISAGTFLVRRAERIVPPYLLLTTALCMLMLALPQIFKTLQFSLDHFVRSAVYLSFTRYEYPILYIGWTLEYEMFFYLLASCALACGAFVFKRLAVFICKRPTVPPMNS
jgi:exopolysaccharide production protein ExoZ